MGLLTALVFQAASKPLWVVADLRDLKDPKSNYGRVAAEAVGAELAKSRNLEVVEGDPVDRSVTNLGLPHPLERLIDLERVGQDLRATTILSGEVIDYRVEPGGPARAAIRLVACDVPSGSPVNGALTVGVADLRPGVTKDAILREALGRASLTAVATMSGQSIPTAIIVNTTSRVATINRGSRSGFRTGMQVIITRGSIRVGIAYVGKVEQYRAEITPERVSGGWGSGARVRAVFNPPALPPPGASPLDRSTR